MKKVILLIAIVGFSVQAKAQRLMVKDVPAAVSSAFKKAQPSVKDVDWSKDGNDFEASYEVNKKSMSLTYGASGNLVETEVQISASDLPASVMIYVKKNHKEDEVKEASKITTSNGTITYEAQVKGMDLIFDNAGNYIKSAKK